MKRTLAIALLSVACSSTEPELEFSGVWHDTFGLNGRPVEWVFALDERDGAIVGRYRVLDPFFGAFEVDGDVEGHYDHPDVALTFKVYQERTVTCGFEGTVSEGFESMRSFLGCHDPDGIPAYAAPMMLTRLKGLHE